jgi:hypothetical protein
MQFTTAGAVGLRAEIVASQNIFWPESSRGNSRLAAAFFFGLFHGLSFAGRLLDVMHQMPQGTVLLAILGFSAGVGNQIVHLPLFGLMKAIRTSRQDDILHRLLSIACQRIGSVGISAAGAYYLCIPRWGILERMKLQRVVLLVDAVNDNPPPVHRQKDTSSS